MRKLLFVILFFAVIPHSYSATNSKAVEKYLDKAQELMMTDPKRSADYSSYAFSLLKESSDSALIAESLISLGYAYMLCGTFDLSMEAYYKAASYCPAKSTDIRARIDVNAGTLHGYLKDFSKAIDLIDHATSAYKVLKDSAGIANAYNARGLVYVYMDEYDIADKYFKDALRINKLIGDSNGVSVNINNLCLYKGNTAEKISLLMEAIELNLKRKALWPLAENYNNLGMQFFYAGNFSQALNALDRAFAFASSVHSQDLVCDNYEYRSRVLYAMGSYKAAYEFLLKFQNLRDRLLEKKELVSIERNISEHKLQQKEKESIIQNKQHQIELMERNTWIAVIFAACAVVCALLVMKQVKRKKNLLIAQAQQELAELRLRQQTLELNVQMEKLDNTQSELTTFVLFLNSRNELLEKIREMIKKAYKLQGDEVVSHLKHINSYILQFKKSEGGTDNLTAELNEQNHEFLKRLVERHPSLTAGEKKLATFIRINLTTKEISLLTGISIKAISMARYRLRKVLELQPQDDIADYLRHI